MLRLKANFHLPTSSCKFISPSVPPPSPPSSPPGHRWGGGTIRPPQTRQNSLSHHFTKHLSTSDIEFMRKQRKIREETPQLLLVHGQLGRPESHQQLFLVSGGFKRCPETQEACNDRTFRKDKFPTLWIIFRPGSYYCRLYKCVHSSAPPHPHPPHPHPPGPQDTQLFHCFGSVP